MTTTHAGYRPTWESLRGHQIPDWFGSAKFGIWAHWGAQSVGRSGDWYARHLYGPQAGSGPWERRRSLRQYAHHKAEFGPPSEFGAADLARRWRAERFDPDELIDLYRRSGARYFVALAAHCDNVDLWDSPHPWNTTRVGPGRDIVGAWERAARAAGLPFGLSFHNNWTWRWLDVAHGTDPETGEPHDGARGSAGADPDPALLYPPAHQPGIAPPPEVAADFYRRVRAALDRYRPDLVYLDDMRLPFDEGSVVQAEPPNLLGMELLADYYANCASGGIVTIKDVPPADRTAVLLDCERRQLDEIQAHPWQFDTSDGEWFHCEGTDDFFHPRKTSRQVIHTLVDVVSKNGTLLLNIPQRADGTLDDHARTLLTEIGDWLAVCGEGMYDTVPWRRFGEGSTGLGDTRGYEGYNEGDRAYRSDDLRFTVRGSELYVTLLDWPDDGKIVITSLGTEQAPADPDPARVVLLGHGPVSWRRTPAGLIVDLPPDAPTPSASMIRISRAG
ncbi:alpha-L-fucosidase [Microlunatus sp. GCM10028923]|uniref:alpha-L-fucosidase n=1 Tax=Microlunatus sp. GCM10028923 TaxID=3273400 RepID=UPI00360DB1E2